MAHGRKLSESFKHSIGGGGGSASAYQGLGSDNVEMRALMEPSKTTVSAGSPRPGAGLGKMSEDSFSRTTESTVDRDFDAKEGGVPRL